MKLATFIAPGGSEPQAGEVRGKEVVAFASGTVLDSIPPAPAPEAREMVNRAAQVVEDLYKSNRELSFSIDKSTNRVVIEVRDLEGNVLKTIPPAKALDVMAGAAL